MSSKLKKKSCFDNHLLVFAVSLSAFIQILQGGEGPQLHLGCQNLDCRNQALWHSQPQCLYNINTDPTQHTIHRE